jgi:2-(1,2-epoxy-1,2-dihydrophenyl)acetyl-CoA isomerase
MKDDTPVLYEIKENVATVTLNQPDSLNALTVEMVERLDEVAKDIQINEDVYAVVLTGSGRGFCSGANLLGSSAQALAAGGMGMRATVIRMNELLKRIAGMEKPWIAAVNGPAVGGGCSLALICDLVIAAQSAYLSAGYVRVGLVLDMGSTFMLARLVGLHKANELAFFGEKISAEEAVKIGLINKSVKDNQLLDAALDWALRLAQGPRLAIGVNKFGLRSALEGTLEDALNREAMMISMIAQTEDAAEGLMAFFQKRDPDFKGK